MASTPAPRPRRHLGPKLSYGPKPEPPLSWACSKGKHYACTKADCPCLRHQDDEQERCSAPGAIPENIPDRNKLREKKKDQFDAAGFPMCLQTLDSSGSDEVVDGT